MDFRDRTLLRLADPAQRSGLFGQRSLENLVTAGYDMTAGITGPYGADFAELRLGARLERPLVVEGSWSGAGGAERREARFTVTGLAELTADALWRGTVTVRTGAGTDAVSAVDVDPAQPPGRSELTVRYAARSGGPARPLALPVVVGLLVRETARPADLLAESQGLAAALGRLTAMPSGDLPVPARRQALVAWLVPPRVFDDADWPGAAPGQDPAGLREARAVATGRILAEQGIGLVVVPEN
ncbi:hypothetical protein ACFYWX_39710 [Streptomyces sp. NPDC002888]|uniref:hypothetical protein n=1 Tax=Streptomyces sp. NPDC002888 TaxID=3364668 RepID=UPI0036981700